ncbi:ATP-dependent Lon protease [Catalinimonas alkaloidigena]|uniref:Lon protease n=1 Tax=Catalinimonas alkaloidigena TaxID=1075417 RepID=A0A1G9LJ35_9BACT|nr:endopeptidase La [Catalinimonas alkaloidigena]SDL61951.1 ATP-dependent Lon protease [Catalinimonas alkaloidigena]
MKDNFLGIPSSYLANMAERDNGEMIPILPTEEEDDKLAAEGIPDVLPILPLKNTVLFPGVVIPITVGRQKSIRLVKRAYKGDRIIGVVAQRTDTAEEPSTEDLFGVGTVAHIIKMLVLPDGNTTIIIQGKRRFSIEEIVQTDPYMKARIQLITENFPDVRKKETKALIQSLKDIASKILKLNPEIPQEAQIALDNIESPSFLTHFLSSNINADVAEKQELLEINDGMQRATKLMTAMMKDVQMLELKHEIQNKVHKDIDEQQRDYFIRQQIKVLQDELGQEGSEQEIEALRERGMKKNWPDAVAQQFNKELDKILRMNPAAAEYPVAMSYAELLVDLPWDEYTKDNFNLVRARKILDADHYGMEKVKERILEYLAVLKLKNNMKAPILCLYGPPGVGKTSLGRSIARALNRKYVRMSLGGVHDEAEIRGHRRTYVGAMPGRIIQNLKKVGYSNPVYILDEIDKVGSDFRGDPSSALLEVLDPEQNSTFADNYLEVEYDLSKVLFIATANSLDTIQPALRDRMEIIEITGYTLEEKVQIAKRHLIPKQREEHGLSGKDLQFTEKGIIKVIEGYTRESGVRSLERKIGAVARRVARYVAMEEDYQRSIRPEQVTEILGAEIFDRELYEDNGRAGVVTGLAWTAAGGEILFVESVLSRGKGKLTLSGQLGDVMKESAVAALSYLKANANRLGVPYQLFDHYDIHLHVPAGAVPKDGPSAGVTILTSLASVFTQRRIKKLAMTGEITLRGKILPVGGIKEKILAARRAGIREVILCKSNQKDVKELEAELLKDLTIHYVTTAEEVLELALSKDKVEEPIELSWPQDHTAEKEKANA